MNILVRTNSLELKREVEEAFSTDTVNLFFVRDDRTMASLLENSPIDAILLDQSQNLGRIRRLLNLRGALDVSTFLLGEAEFTRILLYQKQNDVVTSTLCLANTA